MHGHARVGEMSLMGIYKMGMWCRDINGYEESHA